MRKSFMGLKLMWAKKLIKSRYFVVMTDKESAICFEGADPSTFTDIMALTAQAAELQQFSTSLTNMIQRHDVALAKLQGETSEKNTTTTKAKPSKKGSKTK